MGQHALHAVFTALEEHQITRIETEAMSHRYDWRTAEICFRRAFECDPGALMRSIGERQSIQRLALL